MREIKFRVWANGEKKMAYKLELDWHGGTPELNDAIATIQRENVVLMQYTGFRDRKGQDICEGDVVKYDRVSFSDGLTGLVEWEGDGFYVAKHIPIASIVQKFCDIEVIGNIYENPELLN